MTASRRNVILVFVGIYLILSFLTIFVFSEEEEWSTDMLQAFQIAGCIFNCDKDKNCRYKCYQLTSYQIKPLVSHDYHATFDASLLCKDIDVLRIYHNPGIWVIQQSTGNDSWGDTKEHIQVSDIMLSSFKNLLPGARYRYRAYRVTANFSISKPEITTWFKTFEMGHRSEEVKNMTVVRQVSDKLNIGRVQADMIFEPASDRSCHYDIFIWNSNEGWRKTTEWLIDFRGVNRNMPWWNNNRLLMNSFGFIWWNPIQRLEFQFNVRNLELKTNVTVRISAGNSGDKHNSKNFSMSFTTPYCEQMLADASSPATCAPEKVQGIRVKWFNNTSSNYTLLITWDPLELTPDYYDVSVNSVGHSKPTGGKSVPGNMTEILLIYDTGCNLDSHCLVRINVQAILETGISPLSSIDVDLHNYTSVISSALTDTENTHFRDGIIAFSALATLAVLGLAYTYHLRRHSKIKGSKNNKIYKVCHNLNSTTIGSQGNLGRIIHSIETPVNLELEKNSLPMPKDTFEIHPGQLKIEHVLGSGTFGIVRLGCCQISENHAIDVAVKTLKDDPSAEDVQNFLREILIMKLAGQHQNIVSIIGCCTIGVARPLLVVEYCSQGDLQTYLRMLWKKIITNALEQGARRKIVTQEDVSSCVEAQEVAIASTSHNIPEGIEAQQVAVTNKLYDIQEEYTLNASGEEVVSAADLLNFAKQIAYGMEFLSSNRIIHRDLAARNVLVCADNTVKISDFGLSRDIYQQNVYMKQGNSRLPVKWMALEALTHQMYTRQSDVWSFGILLWEIITLGSNPYPDTPTNKVLQRIKSGYRMEKPENCGDELYDMMLSCWHSRPHSRPSFTQLKNQLDTFLVNVSKNQYLKLYDVIRDPLSQKSCKKAKHSYNTYSTL